MHIQIANAIASLGAGANIITFVVAMLPVAELRLALPLGVAMGLPLWQSYVLSVLGNLVPVPLLIAFVRVLMDWLRTKSGLAQKFVAWVEKKGTGPSADRVRKFEFFGLLVFVAIPLPGTGAWTGAIVASLLDIRIRRGFPPIALGVMCAGIIVALAVAGVVTLFF